MQPLDGSLGVVGEVDMQRHHVGIPRERLATEGIVHSQSLSSYPVQQLLLPNAGHWTQQLERKTRDVGEKRQRIVNPDPVLPRASLKNLDLKVSQSLHPGLFHTGPHRRIQQLVESLPQLTEGTRDESVSVRPSRSAAKLVDTTMGGDTGWTLGGVTRRGEGRRKITNEEEGTGLGLT